MRNGKKGFTLIELLVVMAIIRRFDDAGCTTLFPVNRMG